MGKVVFKILNAIGYVKIFVFSMYIMPVNAGFFFYYLTKMTVGV